MGGEGDFGVFTLIKKDGGGGQLRKKKRTVKGKERSDKSGLIEEKVPKNKGKRKGRSHRLHHKGGKG